MAEKILLSDDELIDLYLAARRGDNWDTVVIQRWAPRARTAPYPGIDPTETARFEAAWSKGHAAYLRDLKRMKRRQGSDKLDAV